MDDSNIRIHRLEASFDTNVFVMMRYREDSKFYEIEASIRSMLTTFGLQTRLAKDAALHDDLWENIMLYMKNSKYGLVVFEELEEREFNPNISIELGYMLALDRRCLVLKDRRMRSLPTDICGKIYRAFDPYHIRDSLEDQILRWCRDDLGLNPVSAEWMQTELEQRIAQEIDTSSFTTRPSFPPYVRIVLREFKDGESEYIIWNEAKERLHKYYKIGVRWDGPRRLSKDEEAKVYALLFKRID